MWVLFILTAIFDISEFKIWEQESQYCISVIVDFRAAARWMVRADTLHQFSLARVQARRVDGHEEEVYE